jgi:nicotinate-nucleotide adenylyltransferase
VTKRIGILGGTFDPIHIGHLIIAETVRGSYDLKKVLFIPSAHPPHKKERKVSKADHRYQLVSLSVADNPFFEVCDAEMRRKGKSYSVETLRALQQHEGGSADYFFVIGGDSVPELRTWKNIEELARLCTLVVVARPGWEMNRIAEEELGLPQWIKKGLLQNVVSGPMIGLSSTDIRDRIKKGQSIRYLVPRAVEEYIVAQGLYGRP